MMLKSLTFRRFPVCLFLCALCVLCDLCVCPALGHDFVKESAPRRWIDPLVPEDLPKLKHPSYFNAIDQARAELNQGRYKLALVTLRKAKDAAPPAPPDPLEAALLKATAQATLGRTDAAIETLSAATLKDQPRAQLLRANILASQGKTDDALAELRAHLKANNNSLGGHWQLGQISEQVGDLDAARKAYAWFVDDQQLLQKWQGHESRSLLQQRRAKEAFVPIERILKRQPKHLEALGLLAAAHALRLEDDQAAATLKQVETLDPDNATAYFEVAEQLGAMRQYPRAADHYKIAIERAPWWTAARNGLGLLYTQSGDEDDARVVLDAAHSLDPFNLATTNYLRLLDDLSKFARSETEHFIVFYDAQADPVIPIYFGEYLESIHKEVCAAFKHEPSVKTYIEVFPTHDAFSVRTTGSPWIGTVGASTGRVIALVAPRKGKYTMGAFNWSQVLRHEYTHTVTLSATDNRIAHWMTEGLAVLQEKSPLRWEWVPMLNEAVEKKKLFTLENLTWGFVRPRKPSDRQLAYAQSFWICQYLDEKYGRESILEMLTEFKRGRNESETFSKVLKKSIPDFEKEFFAWTETQVKDWGYDDETNAKVKELKPKAEAALEDKQYEEALPLWQELHQLRPMEPTPHMRLSAIYLRLKKPDEAIKHLEALDAVELHDNRYAKAISRIARDQVPPQPDLALKYAKQSVYIDPYDLSAHELLASVYEKAGNEEGLSREKRVIAMLTEWKELQRSRESSDAPANAESNE